MQSEIPSINNLVEGCKRKDGQATRQLYEQYARAMYNICLRMMNDPAEAEDVLQEAFVLVFSHISGFRGESTIGAWIKRIVINTCLNQLKKRKVRFVEMEEGLDRSEESGLDEAGFAMTVEKVRSAIRKLPDGYRIVLNLHLLEDHSHRQIAGMLGMTESAVKTQYHRAKIKVRQILTQQTKDITNKG